MKDAAGLVWHYLLYLVMPLWIAVGLGDYLMHRRTRIEHTSGMKESVLHALQLGQAGIPVLLGLLLDINALVILIMLIALVLHEGTALWDLHYTTGRREIRPLEQHVHSFLEVLPLMAVSFVTILYWDQFLAVFGLGPDTPRWEFRFKPEPLPPGYLAWLLGSVAFFIVLPFSEELWRCIRAARRRRLIELDRAVRRAA